ncbi:hypothetical protein [Negadavirga shengliensis]|uniref:Uncharacterized protein n=1 Tax=Negadavirga shengliensis TaxID=1389218 RepID=A0ABV9T407_9BACT
MKDIKKYNLILCMALLSGLTSCFEVYDEGYDLIGRVATIPVFTLSQNSVAPGGEVTANYRYYSEHEAVTELRLIQIIGEEATTVSTRQVTDHNLLNSYEGSFDYTAPEVDQSTVVTLRFEVQTANSLVNFRQAQLTVTGGE